MTITFTRKPLHIGKTIAVSVPRQFINEGFPIDCEWKVTIEPVTSVDSNDTKEEPVKTETPTLIEEVLGTPNIL
jgi:hypothetical protein